MQQASILVLHSCLFHKSSTLGCCILLEIVCTYEFKNSSYLALGHAQLIYASSYQQKTLLTPKKDSKSPSACDNTSCSLLIQLVQKVSSRIIELSTLTQLILCKQQWFYMEVGAYCWWKVLDRISGKFNEKPEQMVLLELPQQECLTQTMLHEYIYIYVFLKALNIYLRLQCSVSMGGGMFTWVFLQVR